MKQTKEEIKVDNLPNFMDLGEALKRDVISNLFNLKIYSKTMTLIGGPSIAGKTVLSLHFAHNCVKNKKVVCYFDADDHPVTKRPDPNLLNFFYNKNKDEYKDYFKYSTDFSEEGILQALDAYKPSLLVIDSIYAPFAKKYPNAPQTRARDIREFLMNLRQKIIEYNTGVILTSQIRSDTKFSIDGEEVLYTILGGDGLKHLTDCKWLIHFGDNRPHDNSPNGSIETERFILIDKQEQVPLVIQYGGQIEGVKY